MNVVQKDGIKVPFLVSDIDSVYFSVSVVPNDPESGKLTSVTLDTTSLTLKVGEEYSLKATAWSGDVEVDTATITWKSDNESVATVTSDGLVKAISVGTATVTASSGDVSATCSVSVIDGIIGDNGSHNGHEYVDLGLSVRWATYNVGATKPEEFGDYYAWGEIEQKDKYSWSNYKWCNGSYSILTKYNTDGEYGVVDNKTTLDPDDDVAHVKWGGDWRIPTKEELDELSNNCTCIITTENGVRGFRVTSTKSGYTDRSIFIPAAGYRLDKDLNHVGSASYLWSSLYDQDATIGGYYLYLYSESRGTASLSRCLGHSVRPVCPKNTPNDPSNQNEITYGDLTLYKATADSTDVTSFNIEARLKGLSTLEEGSYAVYFYYSDTSYTPSASNNAIRVKANLKGDSIASYALNGMNMCSTYYFRVAVATFEGDIYYGPVDGYVVKDLVTKGDKIDLGIPGIKFASCNLGATQPEQPGDLYAWGETEPKSYFDINNYSYYNSSLDIWKRLGDDISGTQYDAATAVLGEGWHMPNSEVMSKFSMCINKSITYNGISGNLVVGPNGNAIFLPSGSYWTSSYSSDDEQTAIHWHDGIGASYRYSGCMIRPIYGQLEYPMEYVDLGLSVKWATCNVGAVMPQDYGNYYAWGETEPYYESGYAQGKAHWKDGKTGGYSWSTYKWCNGSGNTMTKYCNNSDYGNEGFTDALTVLTPEDDVANVQWGGSWRMPTKAELDELLSNCIWTWTTLNGINGYLVTSKKTGYTDRSIFLPAAGDRFDTFHLDVGSGGGYWASSLNTSFPNSADYLTLSSSVVYTYTSYRNYGFSVRPVCP